MRRHDGIGAGEAVVGHHHGTVGPQSQRLADRVLLRRGRTHREQRDLVLAATALPQLQRGLDGELVDGIHEAVHAVAVEGEVAGIEALLGGGIGHAFDADDHPHGARIVPKP